MKAAVREISLFLTGNFNQGKYPALKNSYFQGKTSLQKVGKGKRLAKQILATCLLPVVYCFLPAATYAQSVVPAADGTGTIVSPKGDVLGISGGKLSGDGVNLFHSFTQFDINASQTANFLSTPAIRNILGRVSGGNASYINGIISVTGGNSNLFLMNPAGIVFGAGASLNVPSSFTATTANGIRFGDRQFFSASGVNDYALLGGNPTGFAFTMKQPGAIINAGNLTVDREQNLTLVGGTVLSTGNLSAPGGQINAIALAGENLVRLSQAGSMLSLEIQPIASASTQPGNWNLAIASLPQLLTGGGGANATGFVSNPNGTVQLTGSGIGVAVGDVVAQNVTAQNVTLSANRNVTLGESQLGTQGGLSVPAVNLTAKTGSISVGNIDSNDKKDGLSVTLSSLSDIKTGNIGGSEKGKGDAGAITLTSDRGNITTGDIILRESGQGNGAPVTLIATQGSITTGRIDTSEKGLGNAGSVTLSALNNIKVTGNIDTSNINTSDPGNAGSVTLTTTAGNIIIGDIDAKGAGNPGDVTLFAGSLIKTGNISQSRPGGSQVGSLTVQQNTNLVNNPANNLVNNSVNKPVNNLVNNSLNNLINSAGDATTALISSNSNSGGAIGNPSSSNSNSGDAIGNPSSSNSNSGGATNNSSSSNSTGSTQEEVQSTKKTQQANSSSSSLGSDSAIGERVAAIEQTFSEEFETYFGRPISTRRKSLQDIRNTAKELEKTLDVRTAIIYVSFKPSGVASDNADNSQLEVLLITADGKSIRRQIPNATRAKVLAVAQKFNLEVSDRLKVRTESYLAPAQQLYQWLIAPIEPDLKAQNIKNLVFVLDKGLRSVPIAAFHDGQGFLVERYSVALMPSFSLTNPRYRNLKNASVLAMGAATFSTQSSLPAVPTELSAIVPSLWPGESFLNSAFTLKNLLAQRRQKPFEIVHLATHAEFQSGVPSNSYIQLWDTKLRLDQLQQMDWSNPTVELLVLSGCRTALGDEQAELGFAGLSVQAGVQSALASLWYVSDEGTLGLMSEFYEELKTAPFRAEAVRSTQVAMLKGLVRLEDGQLLTSKGNVKLPPSLAKMKDKQLKHPYYWAAFTLIGNPW